MRSLPLAFLSWRRMGIVAASISIVSVAHFVTPPGIHTWQRIFAVADVFDALTTDRPYKTALSYRDAVDSLTSGRGTHFDPDVVDAFLGIPFRQWEEIALRNGVALREA